jgi:hypothetical protein
VRASCQTPGWCSGAPASSVTRALQFDTFRFKPHSNRPANLLGHKDNTIPFLDLSEPFEQTSIDAEGTDDSFVLRHGVTTYVNVLHLLLIHPGSWLTLITHRGLEYSQEDYCAD